MVLVHADLYVNFWLNKYDKQMDFIVMKVLVF